MNVETVDLSTSNTILTSIADRIYDSPVKRELHNYWQRALSEKNPVFEYIKFKGFTTVSSGGDAHLIASYDKRLPGLGFIGFFESDQISVSTLLEKAKQWLRDSGAERIVAPLDMTILQRYRFNRSDKQVFPEEPVNPQYYEKQFRKAGFSTLNTYLSGIRHDFSTIIPYTKPKGGMGDFSLREMNLEQFEGELETIHRLSMSAFSDTSEYFAEISLKEFQYWYQPSKDKINPRYVEFLYHQNEPIGFLYSFVQNNTMIMKSLALLPEYHRKGASKYLIYSQHGKAQEDGIDAAIYALIRSGNNVTKMPYPGVDLFRKYVSMVSA